MPTVILGLISGIGSFFSNFFGWKQQQAETFQKALDVFTSVSVSDADKAKAAASVIVAEVTSSSWIARNWRPIFMLVCMVIIISYWFGYVPPHFNDPVSPMMDRVFGFLELGMGGYIGGRTLEKIVSSINITSFLKVLASTNKKII